MKVKTHIQLLLSLSVLALSTIPAAAAPEAALDSEQTEAQSTAVPAPVQDPKLTKDNEQKIAQLQIAIKKFEGMGVGVAPFKTELEQVKELNASGDSSKAAIQIERLESNLIDQQKRFYSNKIQVWLNERKLLAQAIQHKDKSGLQRSSGNHSNMSHAISSAISKKDTKYNPMIYPIAR